MKAFISNNDKDYVGTTSKDYLQTARKWFLKTPERALNQAYNAALAIKSIEEEYLSDKKTSADLKNYSENVIAYLQADLDKHLNNAKLRLAEFKASRAIFGGSSSAYLEKITFIDKVLEKYQDETSILPLVTLSETTHTDSTKFKSQPRSSTVDLIINESISDRNSSFAKTFSKAVNKFTKDLEPKSEAEIIKKFRFARNKKATAIKFLILLVLVPLLTQQVSKQFLVGPIVAQTRSGNEAQIFLNSEMKEKAFHELQGFEEDLKFESLIHSKHQLSSEALEEQVKHKAAVIAQKYHNDSNNAISNVFADLLAVVAFTLVILTSKREIIVLKSFIDDIVHGLSDSAKAFIIILFTDIFVGFHSPHGWEVVLEALATHLGLPANRNLIFMFIATFPVILDAMFKFWVFRYLSMLSPSAVATYRNMNE